MGLSDLVEKDIRGIDRFYSVRGLPFEIAAQVVESEPLPTAIYYYEEGKPHVAVVMEALNSMQSAAADIFGFVPSIHTIPRTLSDKAEAALKLIEPDLVELDEEAFSGEPAGRLTRRLMLERLDPDLQDPEQYINRYMETHDMSVEGATTALARTYAPQLEALILWKPRSLRIPNPIEKLWKEVEIVSRASVFPKKNFSLKALYRPTPKQAGNSTVSDYIARDSKGNYYIIEVKTAGEGAGNGMVTNTDKRKARGQLSIASAFFDYNFRVKPKPKLMAIYINTPRGAQLPLIYVEEFRFEDGKIVDLKTSRNIQI